MLLQAKPGARVVSSAASVPLGGCSVGRAFRLRCDGPDTAMPTARGWGSVFTAVFFAACGRISISSAVPDPEELRKFPFDGSNIAYVGRGNPTASDHLRYRQPPYEVRSRHPPGVRARLYSSLGQFILSLEFQKAICWHPKQLFEHKRHLGVHGTLIGPRDG